MTEQETQPNGNDSAVAPSLLNVGLAGPFPMLMLDAICPSCGASHEKHRVENYDPIWRDGDVVCECGAKVRHYDAS